MTAELGLGLSFAGRSHIPLTSNSILRYDIERISATLKAPAEQKKFNGLTQRGRIEKVRIASSSSRTLAVRRNVDERKKKL